MTVGGGGTWGPNERFLEEVRRFADFAKTDEFFGNEVAYKLAAAAIVRRVVRPAVIAQPGGAVRFADAMSGTLDAATVDVDPSEREYLSQFNYSSSLYNLLGAGQGAAVQRGSLAGWARNSSEDDVRQTLQNLFDDSTPLARRVDDFRDVINREYERLHKQGLLKASQKPTVATPMVAVLLALADPSRYTLYRADINLQAAADFGHPVELSSGTAGQRYERVVEMQRAFADAMQSAGCDVPDLLRVHDFLWVRSKYPGWGGDRWATSDFDALDTGPEGQSKQAVMAAVEKLKRVGRALHEHVAARLPNRRFRMDTLGLYPPSRTSWPWVLVSVNEAGSGSPTTWPQLNVELRAEGLDVFFSFDLAKAADVPELADALRRARASRESAHLQLDAAAEGYADWESSGERFMMRKRFAADEVVTWANHGIDRLRQEIELLLPIYESVLPSGRPEPSGDGIPDGVDLAVLDSAAEKERVDPELAFDTHPVACAQLRRWIEGREQLSDEEFIDGLKRNFLRFGRVYRDGQPTGTEGVISLSRRDAEDALASGRLTVDGNQHWTNLARSAGHGTKEPDKVRSAVDYLLDESHPYAERINELSDGAARVKGFGPAHWTGLYAMVTAWGEANYNQTVREAFDRLRWPLPDASVGEQTQEITRRGRLIMDRTGLDSLWAVDRLYWRILRMTPTEATPPSRTMAQAVRAAVAADGLTFSDEVVDSVYLALRTKPFLILTGLSGTGKTKVAMTIADIVCDADTRAFVSVRPDWTDSKGLLGFHNLLTDRYQTTPALELLLHADEEWRAAKTAARPHVLILDEMNLARVEHYFADFLSAFESRRLNGGEVTGEPIALHDRQYVPSSGEDLDVPGSVTIPPNFYVVGTVNVDETTHPFSRKVLDRANTLELFDVDLTDQAPPGSVRPTASEVLAIRDHFTRAGQFIELQPPDLGDPLLHELVRVNGALERRRLHFGYRVRNEILHFVQQAGPEGFLDGPEPRTAAFDLQIVLKVLPKLSGSRERLEKPLRELLVLCFAKDGEAWVSAVGSDRYEELFVRLAVLRRETEAEPQATEEAPDIEGAASEGVDIHGASALVGKPQRTLKDLRPTDLKYPRAARKIARMLMQLQEEGYASFFE